MEPSFVRNPSRARLTGVLLVAASLAFLEPLRASALTALRLPFSVVKTGILILAALPRLPSLARENASLRTALMQRQVDTAQLGDTLRHMEQAGALLAATPAQRRGIVALVIGRSTIPTQQTVLLNRGSRHGLTQETVIMDASGLIGRVMELHPTTALVMLLTDPESRVAGLVERSRETGSLVGRGRGRCDFIYLDAEADLEAGDRVVTAGLGGPFPKGVLLGTVVHVGRDEQVGAAWASVEPAAHLGRLEEVLCLPFEGR